MTDENTADPILIDFAKVFAGIEYPKDSVTVVVNEKLSYQAHKIAEALALAVARVDEPDVIKGLEASYGEVLKTAKDYAYTFHLTAISREVRNDLATAVEEEFEIETDFLGRSKPSKEANESYRSRLWALHVEKIEGPNGSEIVAPTPENLAAFIASAPDRAIETIEEKIGELSGRGAGEGFDSIIRDADFLSQP